MPRPSGWLIGQNGLRGERLVGDEMEEGGIIVNGNEGDYKRLGHIKGGKIYHKGKLIVDK